MWILRSGPLNSIKKWNAVIPVYVYKAPAYHTEWALEKEMICEFFGALCAKDTVVIIPFYIVVFSPEYIPRIQSVPKH